MTYDVKIEQLELMALFDLKGTQEALRNWCGDALPPFPETPLTSSRRDGAELMWIGREHWIVRAPLDREVVLSKALRPESAPEDLSIVLISDFFTFFAITGTEADQVMAVASPLDVHRSCFPENGVTATEAFGTYALIARIQGGFQLGVEQSYGAMIADYLARTTAA